MKPLRSPRSLFAALTIFLTTACGTNVPTSELLKATHADPAVQLVRVNDLSTSPPSKRLLLVTGGKGYFINTNDGNCKVLKAFGFQILDISSLPTWDETSQEYINAKPGLQPQLQCLADETQQSAQIKGLRVLSEAGQAPRYFYTFPGSNQNNKFYELGCQDLFGAFAWKETEALPITQTTLDDASSVSELNCKTGKPFTAPMIAPAGSFQDWCSRTNLSEADQYTMDTLLELSGKTKCVEAEAELRKPAFVKLNLADKYLESVGPIESLQWIRELDLSNNTLADISGIGKLTKLSALKLKSNAVTDIQPLARLTNLKTLDLENNDIISVAPLRRLRFLESVNIINNPRLRALALNNTFFETCLLKSSLLPAPLRTVEAVLDRVGTRKCWQASDHLETEVETLEFMGMMPPIEDVAPLASLRNTLVKSINLSGHTFKDARPLRILTGLTEINLLNTQIDSEKCPYEEGSLSLRQFCHTREKTFVYWCQDPNASHSAAQTVRALLSDGRYANKNCIENYELLKNGNNPNYGPNTLELSQDGTITDLRALRGLNGLKGVIIFQSRISDLTTLRTLPQLEHIFINSSGIGTLAPLSGHPTLKGLSIGTSVISDLTPLASLSQLEDLSVMGSQITNLAPLANLKKLRSLRFSDNPLVSLNGIENLRLERLNLQNTQVDDLSPLAAMSSLTELYVSSPKIPSLTPLRELYALETLGVYSPVLSSLDGLQNKIALKYLRLDSTPVTDLSPIEASTAMDRLEVYHSTVQSLAPLARMTNLRSLRLTSGEYGKPGIRRLDLSALQNMGKLEDLSIYYYVLSDLTPLAALKNLEVLELQGNSITDVSALAALPKLYSVHLNVNKIGSFVPLANMEHLGRLSAVESGVDPLNLQVCPNTSKNIPLNEYCRAAR